MKTLLAAAWLTAVACAPARADTLLKADFEDGKSTGWSAVGNAEVRLTRYAGNTSLKLEQGAAVVAPVSAALHREVFVALAFAARGLGADGRCVADLSVDRGHTWQPVFEIGRGADDGVTLHRGGRAAPELAGESHGVLRLRNTGNSAAAECWADNIEVTAVALDKAATSGEHNPARTALTAAELGGASAGGPWPMSAFAPPPAAAAPAHEFEGRLVLGAALPGGDFRLLRDRFGDAATHAGAARTLPAFDVSFVEDGGELIPVVRGTIAGEHPEWELIVEPGRVWQEEPDLGLSRASVPFALEERNANCMHQGVLSFLFGAKGRVSNVAVEIAHETCAYFHFDYWGLVAARYEAREVPDKAAIIAAYRHEIAARLPTRPIANLLVDHPGVDPAAFGSPLEVARTDVTTYGVVVDGIHYVADCETRFGAYPYCEAIDLPSYSLAKSLLAGVALMRLEKLYPGAAQSRVADLVPECAGPGWADVTLGALLDMASGHYRSTIDQADEDAPDILGFFAPEDHAARIAFACNHYARRDKPGVRFVYHTTDTYLLGTAIAAFYRGKRGAEADFVHDLLIEPIWRRLGLAPAIDTVRRTRDARHQPFSGYGLTLNRDDVARLALLLGTAEGTLEGDALLDPSMLRAALQRVPSSPGLSPPDASIRYQHGFWAWNAAAALGCSEPSWIPFMSGYGGIIVALFPNGTIYYYFSDGGTFAWARAARASDQLRPFCRRSTP